MIGISFIQPPWILVKKQEKGTAGLFFSRWINS